MLNILWISFFAIAFVTGLVRLIGFGESGIFETMVSELFRMARIGFETSLGLTGILTFWLGIMKIGERAGAISLLSRALDPLFRRLMPEVPPGHPALGSITMNMAANALGLDNAATPLGIRAMQELQQINPDPDTASNAQILFLVINTSAVTILPISVITYRAQLGAANPVDVFVPLLLATYCSTMTGLFAVAWMQRINLLDRVILGYMLGFTLLLGALISYLFSLPQAQMQQQSTLIGYLLVFAIIIGFLLMASIRGINAYDAFIDGAREGFGTAVTIIPFLVAMLAAIGVFRASGALDLLMQLIRDGVILLSMDTRFVDAMPTAFMKPFSGSGARAMFVDTMQHHGADSFAGRLASIIQGSTETTFYVLAVYFGAVNIRNIRHAAGCGLIADIGGIIAAILIAYWFFG